MADATTPASARVHPNFNALDADIVLVSSE